MKKEVGLPDQLNTEEKGAGVELALEFHLVQHNSIVSDSCISDHNKVEY